MSQVKAPPRRALLARAEVKLFQVLISDSRGQKKNLLIYQCGDDIFYSATMDGLFDPQRRRTAPPWLREQLTSPPEFTVLLSHRKGERLSNQGEQVITEVRQPSGADDVDLDDDGVSQG